MDAPVDLKIHYRIHEPPDESDRHFEEEGRELTFLERIFGPFSWESVLLAVLFFYISDWVESLSRSPGLHL